MTGRDKLFYLGIAAGLALAAWMHLDMIAGLGG